MPDPLKPLSSFKETVDSLTELQASVKVLCSKVQGYRINVIGDNFYEYHSFLQIVHEKLEKAFYDIGERIRMLGGLSCYSMKQALEESAVEDSTKPLVAPGEFVKVMREDLVTLSDLAREIFKDSAAMADAGTVALVSGLCFQVFDHFAWETRVMMLGK